MIFLGLTAFVIMQAIAFYHTWQAYRDVRRTAPGEAASFLLNGRYARRESFSNEGWRHRQRAIMWFWVGFAVAAAIFVLD